MSGQDSAPDTTGPLTPPADSVVNPRLTVRRRSKRAKSSVEALEFIGAIRRFLRAAGVRVAASDEYELRALIALRVDLDEAIAVAVEGQRSVGRSWAYIATATGTTRQAAHAKWSAHE